MHNIKVLNLYVNKYIYIHIIAIKTEDRKTSLKSSLFRKKYSFQSRLLSQLWKNKCGVVRCHPP